MKRITRTVPTTVAYVSNVSTNDQGEVQVIPLEPLSFPNMRLTKEKAQRLASKHYKGSNVIVTAVKQVTATYAMNLNDFIDNAQIISKGE